MNKRTALNRRIRPLRFAFWHSSVRRRNMWWRHPRWLRMEADYWAGHDLGHVAFFTGWRPHYLLPLHSIPLSDAVRRDVDAWACEFDRNAWPDPSGRRIDPHWWDDFLTRGRDLHRRVQEDLGPGWRVDWHDPVP